MKFEDESQNLRARLRVVQLLILLMLAVLGVRLYLLQVVKGRYYADRAENQRIRMLPIPATRGAILDRTGKVVLVDSRSIYNVIVSREDIKGNFNALIEPLSTGLEVDPEYLRTRLKEIESQPAFESIRVKENATQSDIAWVEAHALEFPQLRVEAQPQRRYAHGRSSWPVHRRQPDLDWANLMSSPNDTPKRLLQPERKPPTPLQ